MADVPEREPIGEIESLLRTAGLADRAADGSHRAERVDRSDAEDAIDFSLVHADDAFLDALGAAQPDPNGTFADDRLAALLLSWRHDVDAEPIGNLVEPKLAIATVQAARFRQRRGPRLLAPLAAAAAVLAIIFAGIGLAAQNAQPGDTLWGLTRVLYADHARSVEAAWAVRSDLTKAKEALASGKVAEAKSMLDEAKQTLPTVASEDGKNDLQAQHAALEAKLSTNPAVGVVPPPAASPTTAPLSTTAAPPSSTSPVNTTQPPMATEVPPSVEPSPSSPPVSGPGGSQNEPEKNEPSTGNGTANGTGTGASGSSASGQSTEGDGSRSEPETSVEPTTTPSATGF